MTKSNFWIITDIEANNSRHGGVYYRISWFNWDDCSTNYTDAYDKMRNYRSAGWPQIIANGVHSVYDGLRTHRKTARDGTPVVDADGEPRHLAQLSPEQTITLIGERIRENNSHPLDSLFEAAL